MSVKQLSVFIENRRGMLTGVADALSAANIDVRAMSLADTHDYGLVRMIVSDTDKALEVIRATGRAVTVNKVVCVQVADRPGGLVGVLHVLNDNDIDVEYMYAFLADSREHANVVLRVADNEKAEALLSGAGYELLEQ